MAERTHVMPFVLGEYETNCFVVTSSRGSGAGEDCWIVDCGFEPKPMLDWIDEQGLHPVAIHLTHAHPDHIAGVDEALARFGPLPLSIHETEQGYCSDPTLNLSAVLGLPLICTRPDHALRDGDELVLAGDRWRVRHAPGHSPGCVIFVHDSAPVAIVGDTLFAGSIGRIDFPGSDPAAMRRSLTNVLMALPDETTIYPGHGPATTIGAERRTNPFITGAIPV